MSTQPIGARLRALYQRSGLSMRELARRAGYKQASSMQRYLEEDYAPTRLDYDVAVKLAEAFEGAGNPPIAADEILSMAGVPPSNARPFELDPRGAPPLARDVPVYGTALGAPTDFDGAAVEQTTLDTGETIAFFARPSALVGNREVYGIFCQGSSMHPRFSDGEALFVDGKRPPMIGDDVVVYLCEDDGNEGERTSAALLKRLVRRTSEFVELEQFNPPLTFKVPRAQVAKINRVIPWSELVS